MTPAVTMHRYGRLARDLRGLLLAEGFAILSAERGRHLRVRVSREGRETTLTVASSPRDHDAALRVSMQKARRGTAAPSGRHTTCR